VFLPSAKLPEEGQFTDVGGEKNESSLSGPAPPHPTPAAKPRGNSQLRNGLGDTGTSALDSRLGARGAPLVIRSPATGVNVPAPPTDAVRSGADPRPQDLRTHIATHKDEL